MSITIDGGAGITFPDTVQQTNGMTNTGGNPKYYAARAWVNFNGNGGAVIRASVNVASVSRINTGRYTITFTTAMPDANYAIVATAGVSSSTVQYNDVRIFGTPATGSFTLMVTSQSGGSPVFEDADYVHVVIFR